MDPADRRIFITYAPEDQATADALQKTLQGGPKMVAWTTTLDLGTEWLNTLTRSISANDVFVVLLSRHSVGSRWLEVESASALHSQFRSRGVTILPVLLDDTSIPEVLSGLQFVDLRAGKERGVNRLGAQLRGIQTINFARLSPQAFEELVGELLVRLGFEEVQRPWDMEADFRAVYQWEDPFGAVQRDRWLIEVKFYRQSRADIRSLSKLTSQVDQLERGARAAVITNGQLTSAAQAWVKELNQSSLKLRVVDGTELERLLLPHEELIAKYMTSGA